jgi:hypothetical protein
MPISMERATFQEWINDYETVWRTPGIERLGELFAGDVSYLASPGEQPTRGLEDLATFWDRSAMAPTRSLP